MSSLRGHALATVAIAAGLAFVTVSTAEARGGYRGGHYGGHHRHGGWSTGSYVALGLGVAAFGGALAYAATRPSYGYGYGYGPSYYSPYYYPPAYAPAYYAPAYSYAPYYYAPPAPYYYAPPAYAPAPAPVAYPSYPPTPAYPTPVSYYYSDGTRTDAQAASGGDGNRATPPGPYGNAPYSSNAYGTVVNPPSPYQTAVVPGVTAAPTTPVARTTLPTVYTVP